MGYDTIIVGAGASGLMAAITAARHGSSVLVIEQKDKAGKKILATGNGKCNYTNLIQQPECYRSDDSAFAMKVLSHFDVSKTIAFFEELGIYPKERGGYLYPNSEQASSVLQVLLMECKRLGIHFVYEEKVVQIHSPNYTVITEKQVLVEHDKSSKDHWTANNKNTQVNHKEKRTKQKNSNQNNSKQDNSKQRNASEMKSISSVKLGKPEYKTIQHTYIAEKLILATGGCASPQLGSDGSGYPLAKRYGHTLIKPLPALVQLKSSDKFCKTVSGVRTAAKIKAFSHERELAAEEGEIIFTDYGISGIPIMQMSRFIAKALDIGKKVYLTIDFLPERRNEEIESILLKRIEQNPDKTMEELLIGLFNHKLNYIMIMEGKLDPYKTAKNVTHKELEELIHQMKEFHMNITDTNPFDQAQVSAGGVSTKEIHENTMESKLSNNLYLIGELVDVDGTCGGYNLQWAWSSGYLAGLAAGSRR